jgi:hypothetical protein
LFQKKTKNEEEEEEEVKKNVSPMKNIISTIKIFAKENK